MLTNNTNLKKSKMKKLTKEEQAYILKHINYDLKTDGMEVERWQNSLQNTTDIRYKKQLLEWIIEYENKIEFLTNLLNKTK